MRSELRQWNNLSVSNGVAAATRRRHTFRRCDIETHLLGHPAYYFGYWIMSVCRIKALSYADELFWYQTSNLQDGRAAPCQKNYINYAELVKFTHADNSPTLPLIFKGSQQYTFGHDFRLIWSALVSKQSYYTTRKSKTCIECKDHSPKYWL